MSTKTELSVYNTNTGISHVTGGFDGKLSRKKDVDVMLKTFRNFARLVPVVGQDAVWNSVDVYHGCLFIAALDRHSDKNYTLMNALVIDRLCRVVKENLAPTYVKGTTRFQQHLDTFASHGFKIVRNRLQDKVNLGTNVLDADYPARLNIEWLATAASELNELEIDLYDFEHKRLSGLNTICPIESIDRWLTISGNATDLMLALGIDDALDSPHHAVSDSSNFSAFVSNLRTLLDTLKALIPYSASELFEPNSEPEDLGEEDDDTFDIEDDNDDDDGEEEDFFEPLFSDEDEDDEESDEDEEDDEEEEDDEALKDALASDLESDEEEGDEDEDEDEDEGWSEEESIHVTNQLVSAFGSEKVCRALRKYINSGLDVTRVDEDFNSHYHMVVNAQLTPSEIVECVTQDQIGISELNAYSLVQAVANLTPIADSVMKELHAKDLATSSETLHEWVSFHSSSDGVLPTVVALICDMLTHTDLRIDTSEMNEDTARDLLRTLFSGDVSEFSQTEINTMLNAYSPQTLFNGLTAMTTKTQEATCAAPAVRIPDEVETVTDLIISALCTVDLVANTDYRIGLEDLCESVGNFELPLDPMFRSYLLKTIDSMLTEKFGEVIVTSQFDLRGVFFKFSVIELSIEKATTISLLEIVTADDFDADKTAEDNAEQDGDENVAQDLNYALNA